MLLYLSILLLHSDGFIREEFFSISCNCIIQVQEHGLDDSPIKGTYGEAEGCTGDEPEGRGSNALKDRNEEQCHKEPPQECPILV